MMIYYSYYKNPPTSRDIFNIISCMKKCLTVSDCALVCTVTHNQVKCQNALQLTTLSYKNKKIKRETTATFTLKTNKGNIFLSKIV